MIWLPQPKDPSEANVGISNTTLALHADNMDRNSSSTGPDSISLMGGDGSDLRRYYTEIITLRFRIVEDRLVAPPTYEGGNSE